MSLNLYIYLFIQKSSLDLALKSLYYKLVLELYEKKYLSDYLYKEITGYKNQININKMIKNEVLLLYIRNI